MVGFIEQSVVKALRAWEPLNRANVMTVRANDGMTTVVNTPLPAIAVHVLGAHGDRSVSIGGAIRQHFELELHYICVPENYSFSPDGGIQRDLLDLSDEILRCMELTREMDDVKREHDLNMMFDRIETEQTFGTRGSLSITADVHKIVYNCDIEFDLGAASYNKYVELMRVDMDATDFQESYHEKTSIPR